MSDSRKDLPPIGNANYMERLRETVQTYLGRQGSLLDRGLTLRDLADAGIIKLRSGFLSGLRGIDPVEGIGVGVAPPYEVDLTPPPTPTGLLVTAGISKLIIEWDPPLYTQGHGHDRTIVYGATYPGTGPVPTFANAVELTQAQGTVTDYATNPATEWHIWIKWKTKDGVLSVAPAGGTNGFVVTTGQDVRLLLDALTKAAEDPAAPYSKYAVRAGLFYVASDTGPTDAPFFAVVTAPITVNGVVVGTGVYMADAFIMNGTITNVKIANAAIDDLKVASVSASKLIAGSIAVGQYIQSTGYIPGSAGWKINGDGSAEFSNVVVRGTIFAGAGTIGGSTIGPTYMRSTNYILTGQGWALNSDGTGQIGGFIVGATGIWSTNYAAGSAGWRWNFDGTGQIGGLIVTSTDIHSNNFVSGSAGWRIKQDGGAEFSNVMVRRLVDFSSGELIPSVALLSWQGDIADTGTDPDGDGIYAPNPYTNSSLRLYGANNHASAPFNQRARYAPDAGYPLTITATASGISDAAVTLWYRINGGAWVRMYTAQSVGISGDGFVSANGGLITTLGAADYIDFGVTGTLSTDNFIDQTKRYVNTATFNITCVNV